MQDAASIVDMMAFVATARSGGFAAAGVRLGRSRSAVAKAVARLEARLGTRLLTRSTRRVALTQDGHRFFARCEQVLSDLDAAEADVAQRTDAPRGILRLAVPESYGEAALMPIVRQFLDRYPDMQVELRLSDRVGSLIERGDDLALRIGQTGALPPELIARVVGRLRHGFYASPDYLRRRGVPSSLDDLSGHDAIPYDTGTRVRRWRILEGGGHWTELSNRSRVSADSARGLLAAAIAGLGIAYLPVMVAAAGVTSGVLIELLAGNDGPGLPIAAVYASRRHLPGKVRAFLDILTHAFDDAPSGAVG